MAPLAHVYNQLSVEPRAGWLGFGIERVDGILPDKRLLSAASACETVASAFEYRRVRLRGKRPRSTKIASLEFGTDARRSSEFYCQSCERLGYTCTALTNCQSR